jgi:hypothetical protein
MLPAVTTSITTPSASTQSQADEDTIGGCFFCSYPFIHEPQGPDSGYLKSQVSIAIPNLKFSNVGIQVPLV